MPRRRRTFGLTGAAMPRDRAGDREIRAALAESRRLFVSVGFFSIFVNLLMLTGPIFMLQVYDRVLTSRSEATLATLVAITAFLFLMMGILDHARGRVLARAGARLQARLDARVLRAVLSRAVSPAERSRPATGVRDLEAIQRFASGTGPFAFFDAPWTPVFLCVLFVFHWMLGALAVFSGCLLLLLALLNHARTGRLHAELGEATARSAHFIEQMRAGSETVRGLGMEDAVIARSGALRGALLGRTLTASDRSGFFGVTSKTLRLFLQSMMLGLGAWLAIQGQVTFGVIIAASILLGRALAPIDQAVAQWPLLQRVLAARRSLAALLAETPPERARTSLPAPRAILEVQNVTVAAPGARGARCAVRRCGWSRAGRRGSRGPLLRASRRSPARWPGCGRRQAGRCGWTARSWSSTGVRSANMSAICRRRWCCSREPWPRTLPAWIPRRGTRPSWMRRNAPAPMR